MILVPRSFFAAFVLGLIFSSGTALGNGIQLISTALETHGNWREKWFIGEDPYEYPDEGTWHSASGTFSSDVYGIGSVSTTAASGPNNWERAYSRIDSFNLNMWADSAPRDFEIPGGFGGFSGEEINIYSTATTRFRVNKTQLLFSLAGFADYNYEDYEQDLRVILRDVTVGHILLNLTDLDDTPWFNYDYSIGVDRAHVYELELYGQINSWDAKYAVMSSAVRMESVPDAGATLVLTALAALGLLGFRNLNCS